MDVFGLQKDAMERILDWKKTANKLQTSANIKLTSVRCTFLPGLHRLSSLPQAPCNSSPPRRKCDWSYSSVAKTPGLQGPIFHGNFHGQVGHLMGNTMGNTWSVFFKLQNAMVFFGNISEVAFKLDISNKFMASFLLALQKKVSKTIMLNVPILHNLCISGR